MATSAGIFLVVAILRYWYERMMKLLGHVGRLVLITTLGLGLIQPIVAARELSEDELRMKERLIALSLGEGAVAELEVELLDGSAMQRGMSIYRVAEGKVVRRRWDAPGSPEERTERAVSDEDIRQLLRTLIEEQYWTFQGATWIPDQHEFLFRFHVKNLAPVEYRCQVHDYYPSKPLSALRSTWLTFVSSPPPVEPPVKQ